MIRRAAAILPASAGLALWPSVAHAQKVPWIVLPLAASPFVAVFLSVVLGFATKSWWVGLGNLVLVVLWVVWFVAASQYSTSDLLVWAPIGALGLHSLVMFCLNVLYAFRRLNARNKA